MPFHNPQHPIAIIGGGLGGLALAVGLVKRGISIHIYEAAAAFSEIGAGVTSGVNAVRALQLIDEKLLEGYKRHVTFNQDETKADEFVGLRWGCDEKSHDQDTNKTGETSNGTHEGKKLAKAGDHIHGIRDIWDPEKARVLGVKARSSIHRARLLEELVALLPEEITSFGKAFESTEELDDGTFRIHFADGTSAPASAIIGADGIKSRVRELVCGREAQPRYAKECAYRAVVPRQDAIAALGEDGAGNGHIYCGYGGYIITYPIEHHELVNIVLMPHDMNDMNSSISPEKDTDNITKQEYNAYDTKKWVMPIEKEEMIQRFAGWYAPLIKVAAEFLMPQKWLLFDLHHNAPYYKGRICLIGDSAHATTPHLGAGAGQAMEDAYILSELIAGVEGVGELEKAFKAYDDVRRPRTQGVVQRSLEAALGYGFLLEGVGDDLGQVVERVEGIFRGVWHEDLEGMLRRAKGFMG